MQTSEKPNKPVTSQRRRSRNPNGQPRPYFSENRWKAPGYIIDRQGSRHQVMGTGSTQRAALQQLERNKNKKLAALALGQTPTDLILVKDFLNRWLEDKSSISGLSYKTTTGYRSALDKWIIPKIGHLRLVEVTRYHIESIFKDVANAGKSRSLQVQIRSVLQPAFQEATDNEFLVANPYRSIRLKTRRPSLPSYHDPESVRAILNAAAKSMNPLRWQLAIIYGLRQGEVLGLQWSDVDLESETPVIRITKQLQRQTGKGLVLVPVKTFKSNRSIPLLSQTIEELKKLKESCRLRQAASGAVWNPGDFVFPSRSGTATDPANDRKEWKKIIDRAEVEYLPLKSARATAATNLSDVSSAHSLLGHTDISVTSRYYEAVPADRLLKQLELAGAQFLN